jgi:hypothetical protein
MNTYGAVEVQLHHFDHETTMEVSDDKFLT